MGSRQLSAVDNCLLEKTYRKFMSSKTVNLAVRLLNLHNILHFIWQIKFKTFVLFSFSKLVYQNLKFGTYIWRITNEELFKYNEGLSSNRSEKN